MGRDELDMDPVQLFSDYMKVTGVPDLAPGRGPDPRLSGKKLGVVNGSSWVSLWCTYFGKLMLPGVKIINVGNEAVQLNFMRAHRAGQACPPQINIDLFCRYARDLFDLVGVDAILISCSTMNRAFRQVSEAMQPLGVPVVQIDEAMMEEAVNTEGKILVIATHGPTVKSTTSLLEETATRLGKSVHFVGETVESAFTLLGQGRIAEHNELIAGTIRKAMQREQIDIVVLAQLSMSIFSFSHPDPVADFGVKVLNSGQTGFLKAGEILAGRSQKH
ncbi:MAG TPA: aspartate/glutamate racemase family protein [Sedimentisphaerales bacterium]|nr:aspartate/glutamate racemase family protein [Sedimentisphaerales bacterium]